MTDGLNEGERRQLPIDILRTSMGEAVRGNAVVMLSRQEAEEILAELEALELARSEARSFIDTASKRLRKEPAEVDKATSNVVSLAEIRNAAEKPDAEFRTTDQWGREMGKFILDFTFPTIEEPKGASFSIHMWAYDWADAEARLQAIKLTGKIEGQLFTTA